MTGRPTAPIVARLLRTDDPEWDQALAEARHDFYHLPGYASLCGEQEGGEARAAFVRDGDRSMLLPLLLRPVPGGSFDVTSPYGYPGPLVNAEPEDAFLDTALHSAIALLRELGAISLFVRMHPILNRGARTTVGTLVRHGDTVSVDLSLSEAELWSQMRRSHRHEISRLLRAGVPVDVDGRLRLFADFQALYRRTMARVGADDYYYFNDRYFDRLASALGDRLFLATIEDNGRVASAALVVETDGIVQVHLSGTDDRLDDGAYGKLLRYQLIHWARRRGNRWLHLGGGLGRENDSLLSFKGGFSPRREVFETLRVIISEREYRAVTRALAPDADPEGTSGFFPRYRRRKSAE